MKNPEEFQRQLDQLPLLGYYDIDPQTLEFSDRIRWICAHECPMYGKTWACPPGVGPVEACRARCLSYPKALLIASVAEVTDISDIAETLATRPAHEALTDQVRDLPPLHHAGGQALPPPGPDAPLRGKPRHQHHSHAGALRSGLPVRQQRGHLGFPAVLREKS